MQNTPLVLASTSPYRKNLLSRLMIPFTTENPGVNEDRLPNEAPKELAERLALNKACAVSELFSAHIIIGSDQVANTETEILGKPGNFEKAFHQLKQQSGQTVTFNTSITVLNTASGAYLCATDTTKVVFKSLRDEEITQYLRAESPYDCAGSFKVESLGVALFNRIESVDPTALQGLPLILLCKMLRRFNVKIL